VPTPRTRRNLLIGSVVAAAIAIVATVVVNLKLFLWPSTSTLHHADAIVVFAGGNGERLNKALDLAREGYAPNLVASTGPDQLCNARLSFSVICFSPDPDNTRGEAEAIGRLAREHRWKRLILVTSTYHVTRARLLLDRCYAGSIEVALVPPHQGFIGVLGAIAHEWGGLIEATLDRSC
jgi:uncharacterized SAM-binding protein YcdF (DUF218 family)